MTRRIFVSYSHANEKWLERLQVHLKRLESDGLVEVWDDTRISSGQKWKSEIKTAIDSAAVAILLVSADFLASDFIKNNELPPLLSAAEVKGTAILPLIVSPCGFTKKESLCQFQAVNPPTEPLIAMSEAEQEQTLEDLTDRVEQLLREKTAGHEEAFEEELTQEEVFHPPKTFGTRGELQRCQFYISPFYLKTKLWKQLADVLVVLHKSSLAEDVYLIPSGFANPHLSDARFLRSDEGKKYLNRKRQATFRFVENFRNKLIEGSKFKMKTISGERTKVYSLEYDRFLNSPSAI